MTGIFFLKDLLEIWKGFPYLYERNKSDLDRYMRDICSQPARRFGSILF